MNDAFYLQRVLQLIEEKLQWGESKDWVHADFIRLSEKVNAASRVSISAHTLKRLFGKIRYKEEYNPQYETKKALAVFLGYQDWEDFVIYCKQTATVAAVDLAVHGGNFIPHAPTQPREPDEPPPAPDAAESCARLPGPAQPPAAQKATWVNAFLKKRKVVIGSLTVVLLASVSFFLYRSLQPPVVFFKGKNLVGRVPHTAVFNYALPRGASDSVFLTFDGSREKRFLPKTRNTTTQYYEYPGFYRAYLLVGNKITSSVGVHVVSEGWKGNVVTADDSLYYHLATDRIAKEGQLIASPADVKASGVDTTLRYWTVYCNARAFKASGDDFRMDTRVKSNVKKDHLLCKDFGMRITGQTGKIKIHLLQPGCTRWAQLVVGDVRVEGGFTDLSDLGQDLTRWRRVALEVKEGRACIMVDQKPVYTVAYTGQIGPIKSIELEFLGVGAVDYVKLYNDRQEMVYGDDFEND